MLYWLIKVNYLAFLPHLNILNKKPNYVQFVCMSKEKLEQFAYDIYINYLVSNS